MFLCMLFAIRCLHSGQDRTILLHSAQKECPQTITMGNTVDEKLRQQTEHASSMESAELLTAADHR